MSSLEKRLDFACIVVDPLGSRKRRQNTRLPRTFKTLSPEYSPRRASRDIPLGRGAPACSPTHQQTQDPVDFWKHGAGPSNPARILPSRRSTSRKFGDPPRRKPSCCSPRGASRWELFVVTELKFNWRGPTFTSEQLVKPHDIQPVSCSRGFVSRDSATHPLRVCS